MDFIKAVSIIGRDLEEAMSMLDQLSAIQGSNNAEIELARSRVRTASELLRLLPALSGTNAPQPVQETKSEAAAPATAETMAEQAPHVAEPVEMRDPAKAKESGRTQEPAGEMQPERTQEPAREKEPERTQEQVKAQESPKSILADRFSLSGTLGEKISSAKNEEAITSVIHSKPIDDIAAAIGMNDKFYFIRELFSGNSIAYNDTIRRLNASASLGEAMKILDESTVTGSDPGAQSSFVDVVRRKFSLNG